MAQEIEAAALDSLQAAAARRPTHVPPVGAPCPNCETALAGPWCHACGQSAEDFHRSLIKLATEAVGGFFDFDGRVWRTLPDLCFRPAKLTRRYLDGRRTPQVPPFRLFLIVIVVVFFALGLGNHAKPEVKLDSPTSAELRTNSGMNFKLIPVQGDASAAWLRDHIKLAAANPQAFMATLAEWAQRLAVLSLPLSALLLGLMFFWRRGVYMFDHLIFSMHSLSFQGILVSVTLVAGLFTDWATWLLLAAPAHLFVHLKGTYGLGVVGTLARMAALFVGSTLVFFMALAGLVMIGLAEVSG